MHVQDPGRLRDTVEWLAQLDFSVFILGKTDLIPVHRPYWHELYTLATRVSPTFGNAFAIWNRHRLKKRLLRLYNEHVTVEN